MENPEIFEEWNTYALRKSFVQRELDIEAVVRNSRSKGYARKLRISLKIRGWELNPYKTGPQSVRESYLMLSSVEAFVVGVIFLISRASSVINLRSFALAK
jgi:hypothetical protein